MLVRVLIICFILLGLFGCSPDKSASVQETMLTISSEELAEPIEESRNGSSVLNTTYTIEEVRQKRIEDAVVRNILEEAIARLRAQGNYYDTVWYEFELLNEEEQYVQVAIREHYSDKVIEVTCYTIELAEYSP